MYGNVEASGSDLKKGAVSQAITFAAYLLSLTILAILAVPFVYFVVIAVVGLPATGLAPVIAAHLETKRHEKAYAEAQTEQPIVMERITNDDGLPVIKL